MLPFRSRWVGSSLGLVALLLCAEAVARGGGGEHYSSGRDSGDSGGGGDLGPVIDLLFWLIIRHPTVGIPLTIVVFVGFYFYRRGHNPTANTQKAFDRREAELRTHVSQAELDGWVGQLRRKDPAFDLGAQLQRVRALFASLQECWFKRELSPVRPFLSDATFQRFVTQLQILQRNGVRDAIADLRILDVQLVGLDQSEHFDTLHVRIKAELRDTDVPASYTDEQALTAARRLQPESFIEVLSFVRKPGAQTKPGADASLGKCPNCGAPFQGGAANNCEFCGAIVNSGNFDWVLAEITQGVEHGRHDEHVDGLADLRRTDPAFALQVLEDRASLVFWKWLDAHATSDVAWLAKYSAPAFQQQLQSELGGYAKAGRRRAVLEGAVGAVRTRSIRRSGDGLDHANVEIRWSARMGFVGVDDRGTPNFPTLPQRSIFTFVRKATAASNAKNGMATNRCPSCSAALTDSAAPSCEFCGTLLSDGERDWVLESAAPYESWRANEGRGYQPQRPAQAAARPSGDGEASMGVQERERLLYMMAAMASSDGHVDDRERRLLEMAAERWNVPWSSVEMALNAGDRLFDRLIPKGSPEAEVFMKHIVEMALVDGKVDRKERKLLDSAALHLGVTDKLPEMLRH